MDLGTMQQNIKEHRYTTIEAFRNDIKQVSTFFYFLFGRKAENDDHFSEFYFKILNEFFCKRFYRSK